MRSKNTQNTSSAYYIYGKHPAICALSNQRRKILEISCTQEFFNQNKAIIEPHKYKIATNAQIGILVPHDATHQGIAVKTKPIALDGLNSIDLSEDNIKIAILDQITDTHNIGAIIRSAAAFGIKAIIMTNDNSPEENGVMAKTSCGGIEVVPLIKVVNLKAATEQLKKNGFWIIGLEGSAKENISQKALGGKVAIVLGAEGFGMRRLTMEACDLLVKIPMTGDMESLNVSNAAAIVFYTSSC